MDSQSGNSSPASASQLFVVSGCSGSGKSTLIAALGDEGEVVVPEPGRRIVMEQLRIGGSGLPWSDLQRFTELCAARAVQDFDQHVGSGRRTFFDRGLIDVACAVESNRLQSPAGFEAALQARQYSPLVFMSAPWEALFRNDPERRHTFGQAVAEYKALVPAYERHGYRPVLIPQTSVSERVSFVRSVLASFEPHAA
jgi:predicted ATPase